MYHIFKATDFFDRSTNPHRKAFQFSLSGTKASGVDYVNMNIPEGADLMALAKEAGQIACKRAGTDCATLHAICNPTR